MSHCSQTFSEDFLEFILKKRHLKNLKKSANKFIKYKKLNMLMKKEIVDSNIDLLGKFQLRNMFTNILLVYYRIFCCGYLIFFLIDSLNVTTQINDFEN